MSLRRTARRRAPLLITALVAVAITIPATAFAIHQFTDVPNDNPFHADIDALADSGVTTGCGGTKFCPKDFVTREQMAAFMNRLGALSASKTPVVNADKVDGYQANGLTRVASANNGSTVAMPHTATSSLDYVTLTLTAPVRGFVLVDAAFSARAVSCASECILLADIEHVEGLMDSYPGVSSVPAGAVGDASMNQVFIVQPGVNTFVLKVARGNVNSSMETWFGQMAAIFSPFDGSGNVAPIPVSTGPAEPLLDPLTKEPVAP